ETPGVDTPLGLRDTAMFELLYGTGARVSEACGLRFDQLHLDQGLVMLFGKGNKQRLVPLGDCATVALMAWLETGRPVIVERSRRRPDLTHVFLNGRGAALTRQGFFYRVRQHGLAAGIRRPI